MDINEKKVFIQNLYNEYEAQADVVSKTDFARFVLDKYKELGDWSVEGVRKFVNRHLPDLVELTEPNTTEHGTKNTIEDKGNELVSVANSKSGPLTEKEMVILFDIDTSMWKANGITTNSWTVTTKKGDQYVNWQTKINWIRRVPIIQEIPAISSVTIKIDNFKNRAIRVDMDKYIYRAIVLGDFQLGYHRDIQTGELKPYHDRLAWDVSMKIIMMYKPDIIILAGDMVDLPNWSDHFIRSPEMYWTTQPAIEEMYWLLNQLRLVAPDADIIYLEGNHEVRLRTALYNHLLEAYQIKPANKPNNPPSLSIDALLDLKSLGIEYRRDYPKNNYWINDNLECHHGNIVRQGSGDTAKAILNETRNSQIIAHAHRIEMASKTVHPRGKIVQYVVATTGVLCKIDGSVPSNARKENWQQGIALVEFEPGNGLFDINQIFINNGKALYNGIIFEGEDRTAELIKDTEKRWKYCL